MPEIYSLLGISPSRGERAVELNLEDLRPDVKARVIAILGELVPGSSLAGFTATLNTTSPNDTVNASVLAASGGTTDQDAGLSPKGQGALVKYVSDGVNFNKRGEFATDFGISGAQAGDESDPTQVASALGATIGGGAENKAAGIYATVAGGLVNSALGEVSTVSGGQLNTAGADFSFVGGGQSNTASENGAAIVSGQNNTASNTYAFVGGGSGNTSSGEHSFVGGGQNNNASEDGATVSGGAQNTADGEGSWIPGGTNATTRGICGLGAVAAGQFSVVGDAQLSVLPVRVQTTDGTPTTLTSTGDNAPSTNNQIALPDNATFGFHGWILAREGATGDSSYWTFSGLIHRGVGAASIAFINPQDPVLVGQSVGSTTWAASLAADNVNGAFGITVVGEAGKTINWMARIETEELVF